MKKILLIVAVLMLAAPAWADVDIWCTTDGNEVTIHYDATAEVNNVRAFALEIAVTDGNIIDINNFFEGECDDVNKGYGIFPGNIVISGGEISNLGSEDYTPVAPDDDPGAEGTGLDTNTIVVEMGSLYTGANSPPDVGELFTITVNMDCNVSIAEELIRGGVVMENPDEDVSVNISTPSCIVAGISRFVPDVVGDPLADANTAIEAEDLVVGNITWVSCALCYSLGQVTMTEPEALTEVPEGYEVDIWVSLGECDYGDANDLPYPTYLASNGARHIATGVILGVNRDVEGNGLPNATATLDDTTGAPDDEDGITLLVITPVGGFVTVEVTADCNLNAWIDFDDNGNWDGVGEQIFTDKPLTTGFNPLLFAVPAGAVKETDIVSRWRVNLAGGLTYTGLANDGEVEDHLTQVVCHVPDVNNEPNEAAQAELIANGFTVNVIAECNDIIADNNVIRTDPPYCEYPGCDSLVNVYVSTGSCCTYPDCWDWDGQCHGDAHGNDGDVDTDDLLVFKPAFGGVYPAGKYDPCADFDKDGDIDTDDLLIFKPNFGQTGLVGCLVSIPGDPCGIYCP